MGLTVRYLRGKYDRVLILILMEVPQWDMNKLSDWLLTHFVLILILMEVPQWAKTRDDIIRECLVLILILMEVPQWE